MQTKKQLGFSIVEGLIALVVVLIIGSIGWLVVRSHTHTKKDVSINSGSTTTKSTQTAPATGQPKIFTPTSQKSRVASQTPAKTFNFIDMTGWVQRSPTDQSFSVKFGAYETYGYCSDGAGILLIGMVYADMSGEYSCDGVAGAVSPKNGGSLLLTKVVIGPSEQLWDKTGAQATSVTLLQGEKALRYDYTNSLDGTTYETIEYDISYQDKNYVAVLHWKTSENINNESGIRPDYFDTIVQKTLNFN